MDTPGSLASTVILRPAGDRLHLYLNRMVLSSGLDGFIRGGEQGLFAYESRVISEYRYLVDNKEPRAVGVSAVGARESLGYYVIFPPDRRPGPIDRGSGLIAEDTQQTLELIIRRALRSADVADAGADWIEERVVLTNYSDQPSRFALRLVVDADFLGLPEVRHASLGLGRIDRNWREHERAIVYDWRARRRFNHGLEAGLAEDHRRMRIGVLAADGDVVGAPKGLTFAVNLPPGGQWSAELALRPSAPPTPRSSVRRPAPRGRAGFEFPGDASRGQLVSALLTRAKTDLDDLRLADLDRGSDAWTMSAGVPLYVALFGRDSLTASWQAAMVTPDMMRGTLQTLASLQGRSRNDWRDEAPGRFLHEAHTGPLETLNINPRSRYYGSVTTSGFFPVVLAEYWHWTGDRDLVQSLLPQALDGLRWLDEEADLDGDGFYEYQTRSADGVKHQAWKDSEDAIVYPDGSPVEPPIATCEEQAFVYVGKLHLAELLWRLGDRNSARRLFREARRLRRRFNAAFWLPDEGFLAMALDAAKRPVATIGSNAGHCLAAGIVRRDYARAVSDRLLEPDLFSGWGIRTLSARHPAYNPYSYHRGTVWPVEQGSFALGFARYGLHHHFQRLAGAVFDAAAVFEHTRWPELFSGHPRDPEHPFPALYPQANAPQAWSASTAFLLMQSMLGLYPYAPSKLLFLDPHLPEWMPEFTLRDLQVGSASVTIRFQRTSSRETSYEILDKRGDLHVIRQASPWSLTEPLSRRLRTLVASAMPGH